MRPDTFPARPHQEAVFDNRGSPHTCPSTDLGCGGPDAGEYWAALVGCCTKMANEDGPAGFNNFGSRELQSQPSLDIFGYSTQ